MGIFDGIYRMKTLYDMWVYRMVDLPLRYGHFKGGNEVLKPSHNFGVPYFQTNPYLRCPKSGLGIKQQIQQWD